MRRTSFILLLIFSFFSCTTSNPKKEKPNLILIMADDLGYEGISSFGNSSIKTPHLDKMAAEGLKFTDFHSNGSVCSPTRAALLTGRYQQRSGLEGVIYARGPTRQTGLPLSEITIAEALKSAGYATGIMGKWHLGYDSKFNPIHQGFDQFVGYVSGNVDFHTHRDNTGFFDWWHDLDTVREEGYVTDLITKHAVAFIQDHKDHPFFLYVPHESPHVPFQGRNDPGYRFADNEFTYYGPVEDRDRAYKEMVEVMDEGIGKIMEQLKKLQLEEETLVVFISDNGGESFGHNGPLRADKGSLFEGGHRVPAIAYWKGKIVPGTTDELAATIDWMPTFMALGGVDMAQIPSQDGLDLSPLLLERKALEDRNLFWRYRKQAAVRQGDWKLMVDDVDTLLFNLNNDLAETTDLSESELERKRILSRKLKTWAREVVEPVEQITN